MKLFIFKILVIISFQSAYAGHGVVVGDGHPNTLTKQEVIESTGVNKEFAKVVERLSVFEPLTGHLLNVGLERILKDQITLVKISETSKDHYAFIDDAEIEYGPYQAKFAKKPTIYFFENYFSLPSNDDKNAETITKVKVLIHEIMHAYFGKSELKVQRVTDLIMKVSQGRFAQRDLSELIKETSDIRDRGFFNDCFSSLKLSSREIFEDQTVYVVPNDLIENMDNLSSAAQVVVKKRMAEFASRIMSGPYGCMSGLKGSFLDLDMSTVNFSTFIQKYLNMGKYNYSNYIIAQVYIPNDVIEYNVFDFDYSIGYSKEGVFKSQPKIFSKGASVKTFSGGKETNIVKEVRISDFKNFTQLEEYFNYLKSLSEFLPAGKNEKVSHYKFLVMPPTIKETTVPSKGTQLINLSCGSCNKYAIERSTTSAYVEITSSEIVISNFENKLFKTVTMPLPKITYSHGGIVDIKVVE